MHNQIVTASIKPMATDAIAKARAFERHVMSKPQVDIETHHVIHGGMYARTIIIPKDTVVTGVLVKIPTVLIIDGDVALFIDGKAKKFLGYNIIPGSAHRKQAVVALTDANITMIFPTNARTIEEAEEEFTDEAHLLFSRNVFSRNQTIITGE